MRPSDPVVLQSRSPTELPDPTEEQHRNTMNIRIDSFADPH